MAGETKFLTKEEFDLIAEARASGMTLRDIVKLVGRSYGTVQRAAKSSSYRSYTYRRKHRRRSSRKNDISQQREDKLCKRCGVVKSVDEFDKDKRAVNGRTPWCKECRREYQRKRLREQAQTTKSRPVVTLKNITEPDIKAEKKEEHLNYGDVVFVSTPRGPKLGTVVAFNEDKSKCVVQIASRFRARYVDMNTHGVFKVGEQYTKEEEE